ncbi:MAG: SlyX family protein [Gammaproteobacteria bacterium]|jgi:SlyX protein|nr:SlyX family protein [Gammaproteobacteria bacterium]MBQ0773329.1 SlyX family protein [Gammaproteobacteria bacterium]|tara:strand:- start:19360 stop:19566 length:207 start_codon:yes stop_codon:yes gene_type:complete
MSDERLNNLESTLAYQDDLLLVLNKTVSDQQMAIDILRRQVDALMGRMTEIGDVLESSNIVDERPPHY